MASNHVSPYKNDCQVIREDVCLTSNIVEIEEKFNCIHAVEDTACGIWFVKGICLQRFANKKAFVFLYGIVGCLFSATYAYYNGTITTLEKRFKIPSRTTGRKHFSYNN